MELYSIALQFSSHRFFFLTFREISQVVEGTPTQSTNVQGYRSRLRQPWCQVPLCPQIQKVEDVSRRAVVRGAILSRTYGTHKNLQNSPIFTNNIRSYLLWSPVMVLLYREVVELYALQFSSHSINFVPRTSSVSGRGEGRGCCSGSRTLDPVLRRGASRRPNPSFPSSRWREK